MSDGIRVVKLGGQAMASLPKIRVAAEELAQAAARGERLVVVVSAMAGETDRLLGLGHTCDPAGQADPAELDTLAATGEQAAAALLALNLMSLGRSARSLLGHELPVRTNAAHGNADVVEVGTVGRGPLDLALDRGQIPVIAGFQGIGPDGRITTLGRGGSDTTAVAIAAALGAEECVFLKDSGAICTADPKLCPDARALDEIAFRHLLALTRGGAKVLHERSVAIAARHGTRLRVARSLANSHSGGGTRVVPDAAVAFAPRIIALSRLGAQLTLVGDFPRLARSRVSARLREQLAGAGIPSRAAAEDAAFLRIDVTEAQAPAAVRVLHAYLGPLGAEAHAPEIPALNLHWSEA